MGPTSIKATLQKLERRINLELASLQRIQTAADDPTTTLEQRIIFDKQLERIYSLLTTYYNEAIDICPIESLDDFQTAVQDCSELYESVKLKLNVPVQPPTVIQTPTRPPPIPSTSVEVRLPPIDLPTFDGKLTEWAQFSDLFGVAVHASKNLTGAQKLQYLKSALRDDAARQLHHLSITDANYAEAWTLLKERYENQREIIYAHTRRLLQLKNTSLRAFIDDVNNCVRALKALKQPVDQWNTLLNVIVLDKLDATTRSEFELTLNDKNVPELKRLLDFLETRARASIEYSSTSQPHAANSTNSSSAGKSNVEKSSPCLVCKGNHYLHRCEKFQKMRLQDKRATVAKFKVCENCLSPHHKLERCKASTCRKCGKHHHTLLHEDKPGKDPTSEAMTANITALETKSTQGTSTLIPTALVKIKAADGRFIEARAMIDQCSQVSLASEKLIKKLNLKQTPADMKLRGVSTHTTSKGKVNLNLHSCLNEPFELTTAVFIVPKVIYALPAQPIAIEDWDHIKSIELADPTFHIPGDVELLIGVGPWSHIVRNGVIQGPGQTPTAQASALGWIIFGETSEHANFVSLVNCNLSIDRTLPKFWEIENIPEKRHLTCEERETEAHFQSSVKRRADGSYQVSLPLQQNFELGQSKNQAIQRLQSLERKFQREPGLRDDYSQCIREYINLGHMERVPYHEISNPNAVYLPHHAVVKESSLTTKLRVVFDASAKTSNGKSLNDVMLNGPVLQDDIFTILLRFRIHAVVLGADIEKMYRQIHLDPSQADLQRIVWRFDENRPIEIYRLNRVTFGMKSAPYLAIRTLHQLSDDEQVNFPLAAPVLKRDMYVDDLLTGKDAVEKAKKLRDELILTGKAGGFGFRKWTSNKPELLQDLPKDVVSSTSFLEIDGDGSIKTLGLKWHPSSDTFSFGVNVTQRKVTTKRTLLSDSSKIFDPLGWLSPVTVTAKILFQQLWLQPLSWDDPVPTNIQNIWATHQRELDLVQAIRLPRRITVSDATKQSLCGFSDASEKAYSAVVYLRSERADGSVEVNLIAAKTKVAPLKTITLPRLELCGSLLLARLMDSISQAIQVFEMDAWTDSTIVLAWLAAPPSNWKSFVANRTSEIQDVIAPSKWHHVRSSQNPADCASRGIQPNMLPTNDLWWKGPDYLRSMELVTDIPEVPKKKQAAVERERKKPRVQVNLLINEAPIYTHDNFKRQLRVTAWILRFSHNARTKAMVKKRNMTLDPRSLFTGPLKVKELQNAEAHFAKFSQAVSYCSEIDRLTEKKQVKKSSKLRNLAPFLDEKGLLRVGGRLDNACISTNAKHPIILPPDAELTTQIIQKMHLDYFHANTSLLMNFLRQVYWIPGTLNAVKKVLRECKTCLRYKEQTKDQMMADLPKSRVNPKRPFDECGVDYAGPFTLRSMNRRSNTTSKGYVAIFVCFVTRAVHIEIVSDLTTAAFLAALRRFISRRGKPTTIHSDCGSNFIGANRELKEQLQQAAEQNKDELIANALSSQGIQWEFNPPSAPHFGGLWEAAVKSFKYHLKRVVGKTLLNFEEFTTLGTQIEAVLNSRPLCSTSADPNKFEALTPGHFLIGSAILAPPEPSLQDIADNRLSRWQLIQKIQQNFWRRWQNEYLLALQRRFKWHKETRNLEVGQLVILKNENTPPSHWELGRITELHPGSDSLVRVVTVKTANGERKRPIVKLIPLPTS